MVRLNNIKTIAGFGLQGMGIIWTLTDRFICQSLCKKGLCTATDNFSCLGILLFVAIVLIVCGYALVTMKPREKKRLKKRIKKGFNIVKLKK